MLRLNLLSIGPRKVGFQNLLIISLSFTPLSGRSDYKSIHLYTKETASVVSGSLFFYLGLVLSEAEAVDP